MTNSWAPLVDPLNPTASPLFSFSVSDADSEIGTSGDDILMESNSLGIAAGNPVSNLIPLTNNEYGAMPFLYPTIVPEPASVVMLLARLTRGPKGWRTGLRQPICPQRR